MGAGTLRPDPALGECGLVDVLDVPGARDVCVRPAVDRAFDEPDDGGRRLVLGAHQREGVIRAEVAPPGLRNPVGIGMAQGGLLPGRLRESLDESSAVVGEPPQDGVRERHCSLEACAAHELDRLVDGCVPWDSVQIGELEGSQPNGGTYGDVQPSRRPATDRLDGVIERPDTLHRPVGELAGERAVTVVESGGSRPKRAVGVGLVLEDAADHVERRRPGGRDGRGRHRRPRSHAAASIRLPPSG